MKVKEITKFTEWIPNPQPVQDVPKFSVIMPTYRRYKSGHLTRAIQSVLKQTYRELELIIIDDGSIDGSFDEIKRFMKIDPRVLCLHHPRNVGLPAIGCYEAFLKSKGEYLMFCFDDTEYQDTALEQLHRYVSDHKPNIAFGYIDVQHLDSNGNIQREYLGKDAISQSNLVSMNIFPNLGAILHRNVLSEIGFFDPHFAIARLTDWDYWKRAAKVYELLYSGIYIGTEFGLVTGNSLGLTYPLNQWMAYEWTERDRNSALTPGKYEEYDIQYIPDDLSDQSKLSILDISRFYESKFWYQQKGSLTVSINNQTDALDRNTKILVVTSAQSATVTLTYEFIPGAQKSIRCVSSIHHRPNDMVNASAVIFIRDLFDPRIHRWVEIARLLGVPHYYYLDDNFVILSEEISELKNYSSENLRRELASFHGVLASNQILTDFLIEHNIHSKVYNFPPVMPPSDEWLDHLKIPRKSIGVTRIGIMSGPHRHKEFVEFVLPAIVRLAKDHAVELVIGGKHNILAKNYPQLKIYQFPFDTSYRLTLGRMQSANIDILVHPGSDTPNNPYKTLNILLNAWALKAFPILSSQPPYEAVENLGLGLLCNKTNGWYELFLRVLSDHKLVAQVKDNLHQYVTENYSGKENLDVLKAISKECLAPGIAMIDNRFKNYIDIIERNTSLKPGMTQDSSKFMTILRRNRSWLLPANSLQERLARFIFRNHLLS